MKSLVKITKESGIPLIGCIAFGIIDRGTNLLQVRCTSVCNMNCAFCSTSANDAKVHIANYIVDIPYLVGEVKKFTMLKGDDMIIFLDSVGEPTSHPDFVSLVKSLRKISSIKKIIAITNGTLLTKNKVDDLEGAGLDQINISLHSLDKNKSKSLFGNNSYDLEKVISIIKYISNKRIKLMLTPVYIPGVNDEDIESIIQFSKDIGCGIGLQKYEIYKYSRRIKGAKQQNYWNFYRQIREWEKKYNVKLAASAKDFSIVKRNRMPEAFRQGDRTYALVKADGWLKNQMIAVANNVCISVNNCKSEINDKIRIKIIEAKNNIYVADLITL